METKIIENLKTVDDMISRYLVQCKPGAIVDVHNLLREAIQDCERLLTKRPPDWLYCPHCGEQMSDHLITERGGYCKPASR